MGRTFTHIPLALAALAAAGCGGFETPDVSTGVVEGRVVGAASTAAFAYPLGRPDLKTALESDGRFSIGGVPVTTSAIVVYDGGSYDSGRAQAVPVTVAGAMRNVISDVYGELAAVDEALKMPRAGRVLAAARVTNGSSVATARFTMLQTDLVDLPTEPDPGALDDVVDLWPVPEGLFDVAATLAGFRPGTAPAEVVAAATIEVEVPLSVDDDDAERGCCSATCRYGLDCDEETGNCYECDGDEDCGGAPGSCSPDTHTCVAAGGGSAAACSACDPSDGAAECGAGAICVATGPSVGYCSRACSGGAEGCPAGFDCVDQQCVPPLGCDSYFAALGASCLKDDACTDALKNGACRGRTSGDPKPGYCTARCTTAGDCPPGYACADDQGTLYCAPPAAP
jgi:hypothetical protein